MPRSASRQLLKELPTPEEMALIVAGLHGMNDAPTAFTSAAYLDHALERLIKAHFERDLSAEEERRMFDGAQNGILGTFSSKIRTAYALGLLLDESYADLLLINDIRNASPTPYTGTSHSRTIS